MEAVRKPLLGIAGEFLSDAAIDWQQEDDGSIYVTSLDFNFWILPLSDQGGIEFYTYWPFCEGVTSTEALSFANECNFAVPMAQFSAGPCLTRLLGHYALYVPSDLDRRNFIMSVRKFSESFAAAMNGPSAYLLAVDVTSQQKVALSIAPSTTH